MRKLLSPERLAVAALVCIAYYIVAVVTLAALNPDMSILERPISGYQKGRYPFLAATTFFALATGLASLNLGLRTALPRSWPAALGLTLAWVAVIGILLAGVFPYAPMHNVGAVMAFPPLSLALLLLSSSVARLPGWRKVRVPLLALAAATPAILATGVTVLSDRGLAGLAQRTYFAALFAWMTIAAVRIITASRFVGRE